MAPPAPEGRGRPPARPRPPGRAPPWESSSRRDQPDSGIRVRWYRLAGRRLPHPGVGALRGRRVRDRPPTGRSTWSIGGRSEEAATFRGGRRPKSGPVLQIWTVSIRSGASGFQICQKGTDFNRPGGPLGQPRRRAAGWPGRRASPERVGPEAGVPSGDPGSPPRPPPPRAGAPGRRPGNPPKPPPAGRQPPPGTPKSPAPAESAGAGLLLHDYSGGVLLSQGGTPQVPSALAGLTSVFGMGTGVTPPLWPPETCAQIADRRRPVNRRRTCP